MMTMTMRGGINMDRDTHYGVHALYVSMYQLTRYWRL